MTQAAQRANLMTLLYDSPYTCDMDVGVTQAAARLGVIEARVYAMLRDGELKGRRVSGVWLIDESELLKPRKLSRPMSPRIAWAAILGSDRSRHEQANIASTFSNVHLRGAWDLSQPERSRLYKRLRQLHNDPKAAQRLASWLAARARPVDVSATEPDALLRDPDVVSSGVSDARSMLSGGDDHDLYAQPGTLNAVMRRHLLIPDPHGHVRLREAPVPIEDPVPLLLVAADLADRGGPREMRRAEELIAEWARAGS